MASSESNSMNILPTSQPFNVKPAPRTYVDGAAISVPVRKRPSTLRRVLHGLFFILVLVLLVKWIKSTSLFSWIKGHLRREFDIHDDHWHYDVPSDTVLDGCVQGSEWTKDRYRGTKSYDLARTSFDLPLSADNLFMLSRGWLSGGSVSLVTSPEQAKDTVTVNVVASYRQEYVRSLAKACLVSRAGNQQGVGIFTPTWESGRRPENRQYTMVIFITVIFPESSDGSSAVAIKSFETDVPDTGHLVAHFLGSKITFDSISLTGSNSGIYVKALSATKGSLHTSNGAITGSFNTTTSLSLETSNAAIEIDVGLLSDSTEPNLDARTSDGKINARLRLTSSAGEGGNFSVSTITSNSPVFAIVADAPVDSALSFEATTSNGDAHVYLHPTYEGAFDVETSSRFNADLNFLPAADPSGKQRGRASWVQVQKKSHLLGSTSWSDKGSSGTVNVHTSNAAAVLDIVGS
ncbi:hypothetical protein HYPSUDRAFT_70850 [Hypholoma sublateritium FD-334 SS-4]|uniref:Uncharacterized protein n=1 Tax=Hypholoma sublateritium (strain FD-334 SS-4) TaxID=945553 RepID=A0A0D2NL29_HYPSF|nr:hypothetical protein HYPSUDRAFT_70850 [Hypholoma sublateritium FD-334 SS-4]